MSRPRSRPAAPSAGDPGRDDTKPSGRDGPRHLGRDDDTKYSGRNDPNHAGRDDPRHPGRDDPRHPGRDDPNHPGRDDTKHSGRDDMDGARAGPIDSRGLASDHAARPNACTTAKGRSAEERAELYLRQHGYEIVERNARSEVGEIDLVALEGGDLVFVEVRSRADHSTGGAEETVGAEKQRRIVRAAASYISTRAPRFETCRFDVVAITGDDVALFQDAFRLSGRDAERF